jgi:hypothetical protein
VAATGGDFGDVRYACGGLSKYLDQPDRRLSSNAVTAKRLLSENAVNQDFSNYITIPSMPHPLSRNAVSPGEPWQSSAYAAKEPGELAMNAVSQGKSQPMCSTGNAVCPETPRPLIGNAVSQEERNAVSPWGALQLSSFADSFSASSQQRAGYAVSTEEPLRDLYGNVHTGTGTYKEEPEQLPAATAVVKKPVKRKDENSRYGVR